MNEYPKGSNIFICRFFSRHQKKKVILRQAAKCW